MLQFYKKLIEQAASKQSGEHFYSKDICPSMWEKLTHGEKVLYGKNLAEAVRNGMVENVVILDDTMPHKHYWHK